MGLAGIGKVLAVLFAIMTILGALGGGNMFQGNQANAMLVSTFGLPEGYGWVVGVILAAFVFSVIRWRYAFHCQCYIKAGAYNGSDVCRHVFDCDCR